MKTFYACFRVFMRFMLRLFYHKIKVEGVSNVPKDTPLLVVPNHQNALIDPLLVGSFIPVALHFLTRSDVFNRWTSPILKCFNMIPIYRIRDGYSKLSLNEDIFEKCRGVFEKKGSVLIFAEGNHGKEYFLRPLTKGAARLALQAQVDSDSQIMILPVGINYWRHRDPKSTVLIKFGKPFLVKEFLKEFEKNNAKGLITLRNAMSEAMKSTLLIPDDSEDYEESKEAIFQEVNESLSFNELKSILPNEAVKENKSIRSHRIARFLNPIPFFIIRHFLNRTEDVVFHATFKFMLGMIVFPIWWMLVFVIFSIALGIKIAALMVVVMILGLFYSYQR